MYSVQLFLIPCVYTKFFVLLGVSVVSVQTRLLPWHYLSLGVAGW